MKNIFISNKTWKRGLLLLTLYLTGFSMQTTAQTDTWNSVRIGGTGNVTSIKAHPAVPNLYFATTDVGNPYRWNATAQRWEGLLNSVPLSQWNNSACGNIAVDPNDTTGNILYATVGKYANYTYSWAPIGKVIKSTDRGTTWTDAGLPIRVSANGADKSGGDRIGVDPQNSTVVYVTSKADGTYKGTNSGTSWTQINTLNGSFVAFDVSGGTVSGVTKNIWIGTSAGVYLSTDGGATFTLSGSSAVNARRADIHSNGTMYVTTTNGVSKWNGSAWSTVSPAAGSYHGVSVNPNNSNEVIVAVDSWDAPTFHSNDGGATWTQFARSFDVSEVPYATYDHFAKSTNDFAWDPFNTGQVWFCDIFQIYQTTNIWASPVVWKARAVGEEEFVTSGAMVCPPDGSPNKLLTSGADLGGFDHKSLIDPPTASMAKFFPWTTQGLSGNMTGVAVQQTIPNFIARVGRHGWDGTAYAGYSADGGTTYNIFSKYPRGVSGGRIAIAATSETMLWAGQGNYTYRSTNRGSSWTKITSVPTSIVPGTNIFDGSYPNPLAADKVNGNKFYIYNAGKFYVSTDAGVTFTVTVSNLPVISSASLLQVATSPGVEGDIWVSLQGSGLYHSTNSGVSFTKITNVQDARLMSVGKVASNTAVYVMGKVNNIADGVFRSEDNGATWTQIDTPAYKIGDEPNTMAADHYGRVFIGTNGNGIFVYGDINAGSPPPPPPSPSDIIIDNTSAEFTGTWTASTYMPNYYGTNYVFHAIGTGANKVRWRPVITTAGDYSIYYRLPNGDITRPSNAPFTVYFNGGSQTYLVNEQPASGGIWILLGTHNFAAGTTGYVELTDNANNANVIADAIKFVNNTDNLTTMTSPATVQAPTVSEESMTTSNIEVANIDEEGLEVSVYPNPTTSHKLMVKLKGYQKERYVKLVMTDISGKVVYNEKIKTEGSAEYVVEIGTQNLNKGLYIMSVMSQKARKNMKVIVL